MNPLPSNAAPGSIWVDQIGGHLFLFDGSRWLTVIPGFENRDPLVEAVEEADRLSQPGEHLGDIQDPV